MVYWLAIILGGALLVAMAVYWKQWRARSSRGEATSAADAPAMLPGVEVIRSVRHLLRAAVEAVKGSGARVTEAVVASGVRVTEAARVSRSTVVDAVKLAWQRLAARRNGADLARAFRTWVVKTRFSDRKYLFDDLPDEACEFSEWLANLPAEQLEVFTQRIAATLAEWNMDLAWVVGQELAQVPALERVVERSVLLHCVAYWLASRAQDDIRTYATFRVWQRDPFSERQKALNQKLYARLVDKGLLAAPAPDVLLASDARRQDYLVHALRQASEVDAAAFRSTLQEIAVSVSATDDPPASPGESEQTHEAGPRKRLRIPARGNPSAVDGTSSPRATSE